MMASAISCPLSTGDITVMSNRESVTVTGKRVTRIGAVTTQEKTYPPAVHLNLEVHAPAGHALEGDEEMGLILCPGDAIQLGLSLVVMGLGATEPDQLNPIITRLQQLQSQVASGHCSG